MNNASTLLGKGGGVGGGWGGLSYECDRDARQIEWPLCMITSDEQISPPSLVCKENSLHLHSFCVDILFKFTALGHSFMQNFATLQFKTRLGGEICSFDVNMHKGY